MRISVANMPLRFFEDTMAQRFSMGFPNMLFFLPAFVISARIGDVQEAVGDVVRAFAEESAVDVLALVERFDIEPFPDFSAK